MIVDGYFASPLEGEDYIFKNCPNLKSASIRPGGFILDGNNSWGTSFLPYGTKDFKSWLKMKLLKELISKLPYGLGKPLSSLMPDKLPENVKLSTVTYFVEKGINGHLEQG